MPNDLWSNKGKENNPTRLKKINKKTPSFVCELGTNF